MTDTTSAEFSPEPSTEPKLALGVGTIVSESFSILFSNLAAVFILAFVPTCVGLILSGLLIGFEEALGLQDEQAFGAASTVNDILSFLVDTIVYAITTGLLVQLAYDSSCRVLSGPDAISARRSPRSCRLPS